MRRLGQMDRLPCQQPSLRRMANGCYDRRSARAHRARKRPRGEVAQLVEHTTENRSVASSILALATKHETRRGSEKTAHQCESRHFS